MKIDRIKAAKYRVNSVNIKITVDELLPKYQKIFSGSFFFCYHLFICCFILLKNLSKKILVGCRDSKTRYLYFLLEEVGCFQDKIKKLSLLLMLNYQYTDNVLQYMDNFFLFFFFITIECCESSSFCKPQVKSCTQSSEGMKPPAHCVSVYFKKKLPIKQTTNQTKNTLK